MKNETDKPEPGVAIGETDTTLGQLAEAIQDLYEQDDGLPKCGLHLTEVEGGEQVSDEAGSQIDLVVLTGLRIALYRNRKPCTPELTVWEDGELDLEERLEEEYTSPARCWELVTQGLRSAHRSAS